MRMETKIVTHARVKAGPQLGDMIDMRILVLCPDRRDPNLLALRNIMDHIGIRYEVCATSETDLTRDRLWQGTHARYQGVILSTGYLAAWNSALTDWYDPLDDDEWDALHDYQLRFGIRLATFAGIPRVAATTNTLLIHEPATMSETPLTLTLTEAGCQVFWYLNKDCAIPVLSGTAIGVTPMTINSTPLLMAMDGLTYGAIWMTNDGCEYLSLMLGHNELALHTLLLGYGVLNWVTCGVFLGERKVSLSVQIDDIFNSNQLWEAEHGAESGGRIFHLTDADVSALVAWLDQTQHRRNARTFTLDFAFNGATAVPTPLDSAAVEAFVLHRRRFRWINHGYTHLLLDTVDQQTGCEEIHRNHETARLLDLTPYEPDCMVTADMSGLTNPAFLAAAAECGVRFLVCDTSRPGWRNPSPNTPIQSTLQRAITMLPRRPNNLFYDVMTPQAWAARYNLIYHTYWGRELSVTEIIAAEAKQIIQYLLVAETNPLMFHQANLHAYDGVHSLLSDLLDAVIAQYNEFFDDTPLLSLSMRTIGERMVKRSIYDQARIDASLIVGGGLILMADRDVDAPLTGVRIHGVDEKYGGQTIATIALKADVARSIPIADLVGYTCHVA